MKKMKMVGCCAFVLAFFVGLSVPMVQAQNHDGRVYEVTFKSKYSGDVGGGKIVNIKYKRPKNTAYVQFVEVAGDGNFTNYDVFLVQETSDGNFTCQDVGFMQTDDTEQVAYYEQNFTEVVGDFWGYGDPVDVVVDYSFTAILGKKLESEGCISTFDIDGTDASGLQFPEGISKNCSVKIKKEVNLDDLSDVEAGFSECPHP